MIDKLIEIGRCYGMEINVEKTKVMGISRQPFPVKKEKLWYIYDISSLRVNDLTLILLM